MVRQAGLLHDIGMICCSRGAAVQRRGRSAPAEFEQIKRHAGRGAQILAPLPHLSGVSAFVRATTSGGTERLPGWALGRGDSLGSQTDRRRGSVRRLRDRPSLPGTAGARAGGRAHARAHRERHLSGGTQALTAVVERGRALVFVDEERAREPGLDGPAVARIA